MRPRDIAHLLDGELQELLPDIVVVLEAAESVRDSRSLEDDAHLEHSLDQLESALDKLERRTAT